MVSDFSTKCQELLRLNAEGFIPGPGEREESFLLRVDAMRQLAQEKAIPSAHLEWTQLHLTALFDFSPCCLPIFYSNASLPFWQGGAAWIEDGVVTLQLRKGFAKGSYLAVSRDALIAHEAVHAARGAFDEPRFEEIFAYLTSETKWRQVLGPIIQRPWEVWPLLIGLAIGLFDPLGMLGATCWMGMGFFRLIRLHRVLRRASDQIYKIVKNQRRVRAILVRLTDREILLFAKGGDVLAYAQSQTELRWRLIRLAYLQDDGWR